MNLNDAQREMEACILAGNAVILNSESGVGKSSICIQTFNKLKAQGAKEGQSWGLGIIFAATQTPPDLIGYQYKGEKVFAEGTDPVPLSVATCPLWMISVRHGDDPGGKPAWMYDKFFLLIDEYGQGEGDVKRALAEIFLNGGTAPWYLPPGSVRVACTNQGSRHGVTKDFDFAIARRTEIEVHFDVDTWIAWADKPYFHQGREWQTMAVTKAWGKQNAQVMMEGPPKDKQGPFCNARTLCAADRYMQIKAAQNGGDIPHKSDAFVSTLAGTMGMGAAASICGWLQFRLELPSFEDVVADPGGVAVPTKGDLQMLMAYELASRTGKEHLAPIIAFMNRLPKDMQVTFVSALLRRDYKGLINEKPMEAWVSKNAALLAIISGLS